MSILNPLADAIESMTRVETSCEEDNKNRKVAEQRSQEAEDRIELKEDQLEEATELAGQSNQKYEETERRYRNGSPCGSPGSPMVHQWLNHIRMVQNELERTVEKADDYEGKVAQFENQIKRSSEKLKEMEIQVCHSLLVIHCDAYSSGTTKWRTRR